MEHLDALELQTLIKHWSSGYQPTAELAYRIFELATALQALFAVDATEGTK